MPQFPNWTHVQLSRNGVTHNGSQPVFQTNWRVLYSLLTLSLIASKLDGLSDMFSKDPGPEDPALAHPRGDLNKYTDLQCSGVPPKADQKQT